MNREYKVALADDGIAFEEDFHRLMLGAEDV